MIFCGWTPGKTAPIIVLILFIVAGCKDDDVTFGSPVVQIVSPVAFNGSTIPRDVIIDAEAMAVQGRVIDRIEFYVDGALVPNGIDSDAPYSVSWVAQNKFGEPRIIEAIAYDDLGKSDTAMVEIVTWNGIERTQMPTSRYAFTTDVVDGKIYVIGGFDNAQKVVEVYDPVTNSWSSKASPYSGHAAHASCVIDDKIYVFGGDEGMNWISVAEVYDPATDQWTLIEPIPTADSVGTGIMTCAAFQGKAYLFGGLGTEPDYVRIGEYDPVSNSWSTESFKNIYAARAIAFDNTIYVTGGCTVQAIGLCEQPVDSVQSYNPVTRTWTTLSPMIMGRAGHAVCTMNGKLYAMGGMATSNATQIEVFDPDISAWEVLTPMPEGQSQFGASVVGNEIYIIGTNVYAYQPE